MPSRRNASGCFKRQLDAFAQPVARLVEPADVVPARRSAPRPSLRASPTAGRASAHCRSRAARPTARRAPRSGSISSARLSLRHDPAHRLERRLAGQRGEVGADEAVGAPRQLVEVDVGARAACRGCGCRGSRGGRARRARRRRSRGRSRPGRRSASSSASGRLVAAITTRFWRGSIPSISVSSWATSRFSASPVTWLRLGAIESISSMKMIDGAASAACSNSSRRRCLALAIGRAHDLGPGDVEEAAPSLSLATARASTRLAGARRAVQQHALGRVDAEALEQLGVAQRQLDHLAQRVDRVAHPAEVVVGDVGAALAVVLGGIFGQQLDLRSWRRCGRCPSGAVETTTSRTS